MVSTTSIASTGAANLATAPKAQSAPDAQGTQTPASNKLEEAQKTAAFSASGQRAQFNAQVLKASLEVSISAGDDSMALLYRSAIDNINELLAPEFGPDALQAAMSQDNSAEATAGRILSQSTAFFDTYAAQHKNEDPEKVARNFVELIRGGFEKGYGEAAGILKGLGVMGEGSSIAAGIGKTYELVQKGYDDFLSSKLDALKASKEPPKTDA